MSHKSSFLGESSSTLALKWPNPSMYIKMGSQISRSWIRFWTQQTFVWLYFGVNHFVVVQVRAGRKTLPTSWTFERFDARVNSEMSIEGTRGAESFFADVTNLEG